MPKVKVDFDVMINNSETYYGTIRGMVESSWKIIEGELKNVITTEDIINAVLKKFPTLEGKEWNIEWNMELKKPITIRKRKASGKLAEMFKTYKETMNKM